MIYNNTLADKQMYVEEQNLMYYMHYIIPLYKYEIFMHSRHSTLLLVKTQTRTFRTDNVFKQSVYHFSKV